MLNIRARVNHLVRKYNTRNPYKLAECLGIRVIEKDYSPITKGYFLIVNSQSVIVLNSNLDDFEKKIVLAHEIGHARLHADKNLMFLRENTLFPKGKYETEANKFAAELLIDKRDLDIESIKNFSAEQLAAYLEVPVELVLYKFDK